MYVSGYVPETRLEQTVCSGATRKLACIIRMGTKTGHIPTKIELISLRSCINKFSTNNYQ